MFQSKETLTWFRIRDSQGIVIFKPKILRKLQTLRIVSLFGEQKSVKRQKHLGSHDIPAILRQWTTIFKFSIVRWLVHVIHKSGVRRSARNSNFRKGFWGKSGSRVRARLKTIYVYFSCVTFYAFNFSTFSFWYLFCLLLELKWCNVDDIKPSHGLWSLFGLKPGDSCTDPVSYWGPEALLTYITIITGLYRSNYLKKKSLLHWIMKKILKSTYVEERSISCYLIWGRSQQTHLCLLLRSSEHIPGSPRCEPAGGA